MPIAKLWRFFGDNFPYLLLIINLIPDALIGILSTVLIHPTFPHTAAFSKSGFYSFINLEAAFLFPFIITITATIKPFLMTLLPFLKVFSRFQFLSLRIFHFSPSLAILG